MFLELIYGPIKLLTCVGLEHFGEFFIAESPNLFFLFIVINRGNRFLNLIVFRN